MTNARREYYLTLVRPSGERIEWYLPYKWTNEAAAQRECDHCNKRWPAKYGRVHVDFVDRAPNGKD